MKKKLEPLYTKVKGEHRKRLKERAKRERKSQGQVVREIFDSHL